MKTLALDPATNCGWAHSDGMHGTWDLSIRRDESKGMRLVRLRAKLNEMLRLGVDMVFFESARNKGAKMQGALVVQAEFQGVIKLWCEDNGIEFRGLSPAEIKKFATSKGNANKDLMVAAAKIKWPTKTIEDDNQADALWILEYSKTLV